MAKKKFSFFVISVVLFSATVIFWLFHAGIIGLAGSGDLGGGTNTAIIPSSSQPSIASHSNVIFYLDQNQVYHQVNNKINKISMDEFTKHLKNAGKKQTPVEMFLVESSLTAGFYRKVEALIKECDIVIRKSRIDSLPK